MRWSVDRQPRAARKFLTAQLFMPAGAVAAVVFVQWVTHSGLGDIGGPIDWIVLLGVAMLGAGGSAILVYTIEALIAGKSPKNNG